MQNTASDSSSPPVKTRRLRFSLKVHLATTFAILLIAFGMLLGWFNYHKASDIIVRASAERSNQIADLVAEQFLASAGPVVATAELIVETGIFEHTGPDHSFREADWQYQVRLFVQALRRQNEVVAYSYGEGDGDYFIVRKLTDDYMRERFSAPAGADFVADRIEKSGGENTYIRRFYSAELAVVEEVRPEATDYDPRTRPWYQLALSAPGVSVTSPYMYFFIGKIGVTVVHQAGQSGNVVAVDLTLEALSEQLQKHPLSPSAEMFVLSDDLRIIASRSPDSVPVSRDGVSSLTDVTEGPLHGLLLAEPEPSQWRLKLINAGQPSLPFNYKGERWQAILKPLGLAGGIEYLLVLAPDSEILAAANEWRQQAIAITLVLLLLIVPFSWLAAQIIARPLKALMRETGHIRRFDFTSPSQLGSSIRELDALGKAMGMLKSTIGKFTELITSVAAEKNFNLLLQRVAKETMDVSGAEAAIIYLINDEDELDAVSLVRRQDGAMGKDTPFEHHRDELKALSCSESEALVRNVMAEGEVSIQTFRSAQSGDSPETVVELDQVIEVEAGERVLIPLQNRHQQSIGLLCLLFDSSLIREQSLAESDRLAFAQTISAFSAIAIENGYLLKAQKDLLESFIKLIAGSIDAKSPYTGAHCQRVPVLTRMLAEAACETEHGPYANFELNAEQWEELRIAGWLHDCGKVTTPEYVIDKATKLETQYDRIHEIRMRFEVLKRQREVDAWKRIAQGASEQEVLEGLAEEWTRLDHEWAFIAECNKGGEEMSEEDQEKVREIARQSWERTLDDSLGLSWEETQRRPDHGASLPVMEPLLADKPEHKIAWKEGEQLEEDNPWGFTMVAPEQKFNRGELHNLLVRRGTLTGEERYIINHHIVQTIVMLKQLPFPRHLKSVPEIAGGHHEKMDGTGYPFGHTKHDMPATARMMAIADIYEALTAADRPYKAPKKVSEAIAIMDRMCKSDHIDKDIFELFLREGVYERYAQRFLHVEQVDEVALEEYLGQ